MKPPDETANKRPTQLVGQLSDRHSMPRFSTLPLKIGPQGILPEQALQALFDGGLQVGVIRRTRAPSDRRLVRESQKV